MGRRVMKSESGKKYDIIVIGAGLSGLLSAYYLQKEGMSVLVIEAGTVASGQTGRTTAKITSQHGLKYDKLIITVGMKKAWMYARANEDAILEYEKLIRDEGIDCDFKRAPAYLYTTETEDNQVMGYDGNSSEFTWKKTSGRFPANSVEKLKREEDAAKQLGIKAVFTRETGLPFKVTGALRFDGQAMFSPLKFVESLVEKIEAASVLKVRVILENTKVLKIKGHRVVTEKGDFFGENIIMATHYPIRNFPGFYFLRQHQERSYVLELSGCKPLEGMYIGIDENGLSFRQFGNRLWLGGEGHRTGEHPFLSYDCLSVTAHRYFPNCTETGRRSAQDCMPHDGIPFIGRYSIFTPHLYVITGFGKWGMTSSMIAAMVLRDELCGESNPYRKLFTPQRLNFRAGFINFMHDVGMSVKGLWKGAFGFPKDTAASLPKGHGGIVSINRERFACYRDENGELHKFSARCPHLGCELTWNPDEKSWDCPCHGSRFDVAGNLLDNPAKRGLKQR